MTDKKLTAAERFANLIDKQKQDGRLQIDAAKLELSEQIYQAMESKGITEAELSRRLGVSRAYVNKILQGNVNFTIETLVKIGQALDYKFEFQFVDKTTKADVLDAEIVYEKIEKTIPMPSPRHGYSANICDFNNFRLRKIKDLLITDTEVDSERKSEKSYASRENAA
jgi:transcriptional regulator with XRE-family HTH domain